MRLIRTFIESVVDLVYPPEEGDEPVTFRTKLWVFVFLCLVVLLGFALSR